MYLRGPVGVKHDQGENVADPDVPQPLFPEEDL